MSKKNNTNIFLIGLLFLSVLFFSCDTEYIDKVNAIPGDVIKVPGYTQIETFTFKDSENNAISAAITDENIVVTWSVNTVLPTTIKPEIVLGTEASITPASGAEVAFKDGTVYTVTSKAGTTKKYTLKIDFRQIEPNTWTYAAPETFAKGSLQKLINNAIGGSNNGIENLWLSKENTRVYLVAAADQKTEYTAEIVHLGGALGTSSTTTPFISYGIYYFLPEDMPVGTYDLRVKNGIYTLQNASVENRFKISVIEPASFAVESVGSPVQKQGGETFEVRGGMMNAVTSVIMYNSTAATITYPVEIVSATSYRIVLKVPAGTPAGTFNRMRFYRGTANTLSSFTVTVK
ncbi:hypothetical protein [Flavobacterium quisquiliarum]|uniref:DUF5018 domain-containing protein n=1 Tax=Flavobacterium quisquiliarum TaxID=1834436 RepID=A0ABV8W6G3_9FLAO|nr:hypothetical protein [Flavobacterium quisquiliarum]MBW1655669.1 hypothetical protein [Flavobacterium quisquiliarum]NWL03293.1 hypothetical protein [Flavobacterium collinsii]